MYADYESTQDDRLHVPILICAKGEDHLDNVPALVFYGRSCTEQFYDWLLTKTEVFTISKATTACSSTNTSTTIESRSETKFAWGKKS